MMIILETLQDEEQEVAEYLPQDANLQENPSAWEENPKHVLPETIVHRH